MPTVPVVRRTYWAAVSPSGTKSLIRRVAALFVGVLVLTGCQLDLELDVRVAPDGTGTITFVATADAELVERVPDLATALVLDDIAAAGWLISGPTPTESGGLTLTITHDFESAAEATNLLRSLGPPYNDPELGRGDTGDTTNNRFTGSFGLPGGFEAFADDDLIAAVGSVPFATEFAETGATPANSMSAVFRLQLPGEIVDDETNPTEVLDDGTMVWQVPLDGISVLEVSARSEQAPAEGNAWARPLSIVALILLLVWVGFMTLFILYVVAARYRRARQYQRRNPRDLPEWNAS